VTTTMTGSGRLRSTPPEGNPAFIRRSGRQFIINCYSAARAARLYPPEHAGVQRALEDLVEVAEEIRSVEGDLEIRFSGEYIFINDTRLRLDLTNYASFSRLLSLCHASGVGAIHCVQPAAPRDWLVLLSQLDAPSISGHPEANFESLVQRLESAAITVFELEPPSETEAEREVHEQVRQAAVRTYAQSVAVTKDVMTSFRLGRTPSVRRIKRLVQSIVDQILTEETSLIALTTIRDYDEYTFTHSVNVCIFSVALGRRLGLTKKQLYEIGIAALFHDLGKSRVPLPLLQKAEDLNEEEWKQMMDHPWLGMLTLFQLRGQSELPYRAMVCAYEHHMKYDLTGYPKPIRPRALGMTSKIVAVADGYDAATSRRTYQTEPWPPPAVLQEMRDNPRRGMDPAIVKAFINLLGIYPVGTLVVLDTFELAVVAAANPSPDLLSRPLVLIISDPQGMRLHPVIEVDLGEQEGGAFKRTIIKTADPDRYGIRVGDYFV
jgi:HD-GYP domain-containing protein (c-di-GMP phosphodiesterase class II)